MRWDPLQRLHLVYPGGGGGQQQTTTQTLNYSPEEAARRAQVMAEAQNIYNATKDKTTTLAPTGPSADTTQAMQMTKNLALGPMSQITGQLPGAIDFGMNAVLNPTDTPGFQSTLDTAIRRAGQAYTDPTGVIARIGNQFDANNSGGTSTREGIAGGIAGREYLNTVGDITGRLTSDAYSKGLDTYARTLALTPQLMNSMTMPANLVASTGATDEAYQEMQRQWQLNAPWAALSPYANVVQGFSNPTSVATSPGARTNPMMGALGGAAAGAAMGSVIPGVGTAAGATAGLIMGLMS